ncbi:MAG: phasin family protein [Desulfobulbales bacterium]|nr:phasin family protein [Desulfobulbales bacterium]
MFEIFKKSLFAGLGLAVVTKTKLESVLEKMVAEGKMSREEAEKMGQDLLESGEKQWSDFETRLKETVKGFLDNMDICKASDVKKLEKKVKAIDLRLKALEGPKEKKTLKK